MGKKGSWNTSSQNRKDLNHTGWFWSRGSLNSSIYHCCRFLSWEKTRDTVSTASWQDGLPRLQPSERASHHPAPGQQTALSWLQRCSLDGHLIKTQALPGGTSGQEPTCQCRRCETWVQSLGQEDPLSRKWQHTPVFLPWECHRGAWWAIQYMGLHRVGHDRCDLAAAHTHTHTSSTSSVTFAQQLFSALPAPVCCPEFICDNTSRCVAYCQEQQWVVLSRLFAEHTNGMYWPTVSFFIKKWYENHPELCLLTTSTAHQAPRARFPQVQKLIRLFYGVVGVGVVNGRKVNLTSVKMQF